MQIEKLKVRHSTSQNPKLSKAYRKMENIIIALKKKEISQEIWDVINADIKKINAFIGTEKALIKALKKTSTKILTFVEKELQYVSKHHYRNQWMALGIALFGVALGTVFSSILGNYSFMSIGIPIGMGIGMAYGTTLDKKAEDNGKQLDLVCDR